VGFAARLLRPRGVEHSKFQETERVINPMAGDSEVLTVKEVCELLRVHPSTVYKLLRQGKLPSFRVGSEWRFRKDLVMSWMAQRSMEAQQMRRVIETGVNGGSRH
jgi:excisionase family DNA binding protein